MTTKSINVAKQLSWLSVPLLLVSAGALANDVDLSEITTLPVITEDCGSSVCVDRRAMSVAQIQAILDGAAAQAATAQSQGNQGNQGNDGVRRGQGLAIGQNNNDTQVVFLDFEQSSPVVSAIAFGAGPETFMAYEYTQAERDEIQRRIETDYEGFDISFTQDRPTSGDYSTLVFECLSDICVNFQGGILFGQAQAIDIGNQNRNDLAFVDASLWTILAQVDPSGAFFTQISGVPVVDGDLDAAVSFATVNQAANTGAHELGHNLGLRHHDSFGSPGTGIPSTGVPAPNAFFPVFDGPQGADESILHLMASGASVGSSFTDSTLRDRFLSERSTVKLAANQRGRLVHEDAVTGKNKYVQLRKVVAPNPVLEGENADGKLIINEALIRGSISEAGEIDSYRFKGKGGTFLSAEFNGFDVPVGDPVIGAIQLFFVNDLGELELVAENFQNFEGFDALLVDAPLERDGDYVLQVSAPDFLVFDSTGDGIPNLFPLTGVNAQFLTGDYNLSIYQVEGGNGRGPSRVPGA